MERNQEQLERFLKKKLAARTCQNLIGRYCFYHSAMRGEDILNMWSKNSDTRIEMPWGVYDGPEGVRRRYLDEQPRHDDLEGRKGNLVVEALSTMVFEVAEDTKTARGAWFCQGLQTEVKNGKAECKWLWTKYGVDFIYENGEWKIWHMAIFPIIDTPYEVAWNDHPRARIEDWTGVSPDRKPTARYLWNMHPDNKYPMGHPATPKPYDNFDLEVGYGY